MTSSRTSRALSLKVATAEDALDRFEAAWHLATGRHPPAPVALLSFAGLPLLLKTLTPARWSLLQALHASGPQTIFALARRLERDYKNVHTDVRQLLALGLIEKGGDGTVAVPWDAVRAELRLKP